MHSSVFRVAKSIITGPDHGASCAWRPPKATLMKQGVEFNENGETVHQAILILVSSYHGGKLGACPRIVIVARARLVESDFSII
jgi:hypothetical protein